MALSFQSVQKAYRVLNEIKETVLPDLVIDSWPEDLFDWSDEERKNPQLNRVYGFDKKSDNGWENLVFFVEKPDEKLKVKFDELKENVPNSSFAKPYKENSDFYIFGWF